MYFLEFQFIYDMNLSWLAFFPYPAHLHRQLTWESTKYPLFVQKNKNHEVWGICWNARKKRLIFVNFLGWVKKVDELCTRVPIYRCKGETESYPSRIHTSHKTTIKFWCQPTTRFKLSKSLSAVDSYPQRQEVLLYI